MSFIECIYYQLVNLKVENNNFSKLYSQTTTISSCILLDLQHSLYIQLSVTITLYSLSKVYDELIKPI